jgi:hypothetical protein
VAIPDDCEQDVWKPLSDSRQRTNDLILTFARLKSPSRQYDEAAAPAETLSDTLMTSSGNEVGRVDTRMDDVDSIRIHLPVRGQLPFRVVTAGYDQFGTFEHPSREEGQLTARSRDADIFSLDVTQIGNPEFPGKQPGQQTFRQTPARMDGADLLTRHHSAQMPEGSRIALQSAAADECAVFHFQWQAMDSKVVSEIERFVTSGCVCGHYNALARKPPIKLVK